MVTLRVTFRPLAEFYIHFNLPFIQFSQFACFSHDLAVFSPFLELLTRIDPDDPEGHPVTASGISPGTFTKNLGSIGPFLAKLWTF